MGAGSVDYRVCCWQSWWTGNLPTGAPPAGRQLGLSWVGVLKSIFSAINMATPTYICFLAVSFTILLSLSDGYPWCWGVFLGSAEQWILFYIHSVSLCLLIVRYQSTVFVDSGNFGGGGGGGGVGCVVCVAPFFWFVSPGLFIPCAFMGVVKLFGLEFSFLHILQG